jgi:uncharacterized membrane protein YkvA (DUF1232 family)
MEPQLHHSSFWAHARRLVGKVSFLSDALVLFFCMADEGTPPHVQALIAGALMYFVLPADAVPDWVPIYGWVDDSAVVAGMLAIAAEHITEAHRRRARAWFAGDVAG